MGFTDEELHVLLSERPNENKIDRLESNIVASLIDGQFSSVIDNFSSSSVSHELLCSHCLRDDCDSFFLIQKSALAYIQSIGGAAVWDVLWLGIAYLQLYVQCNYTGPELSARQRQLLDHENLAGNESTVCKMLHHLECDGVYPFPLVDMPHLLLVARALLSLLGRPDRGSWKLGTQIDDEGNINNPSSGLDWKLCFSTATLPESGLWWSARAACLHARTLQTTTLEAIPTLWHEVSQSFEGVWLILSARSEEENSPILGCLARLEHGLALQHFQAQDRGHRLILEAQQLIGLTTNLTAALGKRTKYQREEVAQLFLFAQSNQDNQRLDSAPSTTTTPTHTLKDDALTNKLEIGQRMVVENERGEEVAVREVLLDEVDTGRAENIILEGGPAFGEQRKDYDFILTPIERAVILARCLDVGNSHAADQLTNEEMRAYIERVLASRDQKREHNWMVYSTALLQRSWIEFEGGKTMDRAMLQIQALIDQHSTRLTVTQASYQAIEEAANATERLRCIYQLVYPAQFELKKDLAQRYLRCQVFMSALQYFKELEMWDEVVTCYQLMQKPQRAEMVVREQLKKNETPYMITALADLTGKEELYERAWQLSKRRYPRAKRTLAKLCFDRGEYQACCDHLSQALAVHPLVPTAWYLKGIAAMRLEDWDVGLEAFSRSVQQDPELREAWANLGAIYMHLQSWTKAHHALHEAWKQKRDDWRVMENLLKVNMHLSKWLEAIHVLGELSSLRPSSDQQGKEYANILNQLPVVRYLALLAAKENRNTLQNANEAEAGKDDPSGRTTTSTLLNRAQQLLTKITTILRSNANVWSIVAEFNEALMQFDVALDARTKQFRALLAEVNWDQDNKQLDSLLDCSERLLEVLEKHVTASPGDRFGCKMLLQSTSRKLSASSKSHSHSFAMEVSEKMNSLAMKLT